MTIEERLEPFSTGLIPAELERYRKESKEYDAFALRVKEGGSYCNPRNLCNDILVWIRKSGYTIIKTSKPLDRLKKMGVIIDDPKKRIKNGPEKTPLAIAMFSLMDQVEGKGDSSLLVELEGINVQFDSDGDLNRQMAYAFLIDVQPQVDVWFNVSIIRGDTVKQSVSAKENPSPPMRKGKGIK